MFARFIEELRHAGIRAGLGEHLTLIEGLRAGLCDWSVDDFYAFARACLVKDERQFDRFDRVFAKVFGGLATAPGMEPRDLPEEWLRWLAERLLTPDERARLEALGWDRLMATLAERLAEQKGRHQGGSKWIGTAGTSPFGAYGEHVEGVRIGQHESRHRRAVKVWDARAFKDYDGDGAITRRNVALALRRLRRLAREGRPDELDIDGTVERTARQGGLLDLAMRPERRNTIKILLLLDVGGSMDDHVQATAELFTALSTEFRHVETWYFHNCVYERLWRENRRRHETTRPTWELLNGHGPDWRLILVGDAAMSPHEVTLPGASVEHWNEESGEVWLSHLLARFPKAAWLNPKPEPFWRWTESTVIVNRLMGGRMFPVTLDGIDRAAAALAR